MDKVIENSLVVRYQYANEIMIIVRDLRARGLIQGEDFDFQIERQGTARLYFKHPELATFYRLKYS